jgi:hypothetical protein
LAIIQFANTLLEVAGSGDERNGRSVALNA